MNKKTVLLFLVLFLLNSFIVSAVSWDNVYNTTFDTDDFTDVGSIIYVDTGNSRMNVQLERGSPSGAHYSYKPLTINTTGFRVNYTWITPSTINTFTYGRVCLANQLGDYVDITDEAVCFRKIGSTTIGDFENVKDGTNTGDYAFSTSTTYNMLWVYDGVGDIEFYIYQGGSEVFQENLSVTNLNISKFTYFIVTNYGTSSSSLTDTYYMDDLYIDESSGVNNFSITSESFWSGDGINSFNASIGGVGNFSTTNGTIITSILDNSTNLYNITITASDRFSRSYEDVNVSTNLLASLKQTDITFNFKFSSGDLVPTPINLTSVNTSTFFNVSGGSQNIFPDDGIQVFNVSCDAEVFAPFTISLNLTALENSTYNYTVNETQTVLTFLDANTTNPIQNATITITYPSNNTITRTTNSSGKINFSYVRGSTLEFGEYTFNFDKIGFLEINLTETINATTIPFSKTYNISRATLNIFIYDRDGNLLTDNMTVAMIGVFNETTNTGSVIKNNLTIVSGEYTIYATGDAYKTETRTFTYTNQENLTINFYMLNLSDPNLGVLTVNTLDSFFRKLTDVKVELLEYRTDSASFVSVSECITNVNAQCDFNVELNSKVYYLTSNTFINNVLLTSSTSESGEIFTSTPQSRNLVFYTRTIFSVEPSTDLIYDVSESFVNNVSSISVDFFSNSGTAYTVCIEYLKLVDKTFTSVAKDCLTSTSALQNVNRDYTLNRSNTYEARVYIDTTEDIRLKTYSYPKTGSFADVFGNDVTGAIMLLLWVGALALGVWTKNMVLFLFISLALPWISVWMFPLFTVVVFAVFKNIISILTILVARKKKDFN